MPAHSPIWSADCKPGGDFASKHFDGSFMGKPGLASIGGVFCNNSGRFIFGFACYVGATFAYVAEAFAARLALKMAKDHNFTHVIFEGDSQLLVNLIAGARVRVECKDRETLKVAYHVDGVTDTTGTYRITVADDHEDELCESVLISSPQTDCTAKTPGRDRSRVILTNNNGIISNIRNANAMGFTKDTALSGCTQLLKQYQEYDE
ncbi:pollen-specific protein C13-like [Macadamia integrifolia]|uniref:pollen-specific protein C13-like n=1 Tax=Macadamia integrifolia TaxID=60698 RepID=UPI001C4FBD5F|nr:pollen-specific protein C13-like [Macadamia integrifolia]